MMGGERKPVASPAFHFGFPTLLPPHCNPPSTRRPEQYRRYGIQMGKSLYKHGPFGITSCCRTQECRPAGTMPGLSPMSIKRCRLLPMRTIAVPPPNSNGCTPENCLGDKPPPRTRLEMAAFRVDAHFHTFDHLPIPGLSEFGQENTSFGFTPAIFMYN